MHARVHLLDLYPARTGLIKSGKYLQAEVVPLKHLSPNFSQARNDTKDTSK